MQPTFSLNGYWGMNICPSTFLSHIILYELHAESHPVTLLGRAQLNADQGNRTSAAWCKWSRLLWCHSGLFYKQHFNQLKSLGKVATRKYMSKWHVRACTCKNMYYVSSQLPPWLGSKACWPSNSKVAGLDLAKETIVAGVGWLCMLSLGDFMHIRCTTCEISRTFKSPQVGKINLQTDHRGIAHDHNCLAM